MYLHMLDSGGRDDGKVARHVQGRPEPVFMYSLRLQRNLTTPPTANGIKYVLILNDLANGKSQIDSPKQTDLFSLAFLWPLPLCKLK